MTTKPTRYLLLMLALLLCLGGCKWRTDSPGESTTQAVPSAQGQSAITEPSQSGGAVVMPSLQGGDMLYPTFAGRDGWGGSKVGLINARGETVAPRVYDELRYVTDAEEATVTGLLAGRVDPKEEACRWTYYALDGSVLAEPGHAGYMNPLPGGHYAEIGRTYHEVGGDEDTRDLSGGLWDLRENKQVLEPAYGQELSQIAEDRFFVITRRYDPETWDSVFSDPCIFNAKTGERGPAPEDLGSISTWAMKPGDLLIPAMSASERWTWGYVNRDLEWVLTPRYSDASAFDGRDYAIANDKDNKYYVIASDGTAIYESEDPLTVYGEYVVMERYWNGRSALFQVKGGECGALLEPSYTRNVFWLEGGVFAVCDSEAGTTVFRDFTEGKDLCSLNVCYGSVRRINENLVEMQTDPYEKVGNEMLLFNFRTKREIPVSDWMNCYIETIGPVVQVYNYLNYEYDLLDAGGLPLEDTGMGRFGYTGRTSANYGGLPDLLPAYPWVTQGLYAGYIDEQGNWLYRQSKYQGLED